MQVWLNRSINRGTLLLSSSHLNTLITETLYPCQRNTVSIAQTVSSRLPKSFCQNSDPKRVKPISLVWSASSRVCQRCPAEYRDRVGPKLGMDWDWPSSE